MLALRPHLPRWAKLAALVAVLWLSYRPVWPGAQPYTELLKPTIIAVVFAVSGELLGVATMPVVVVFCLSFYAHDLISLYLNWPRGDPAAAVGERSMFFWVSVLMSAVSLWGPLLCGMVAFALTRTIRRGKPPKQAGWGR